MDSVTVTGRTAQTLSPEPPHPASAGHTLHSVANIPPLAVADSFVIASDNALTRAISCFPTS
jgi:hypothetical protein